MAYLRPSWFVRRFNKLAMKLGIGGAETLQVTRPSTGGVQQVPVITVEHQGQVYLVSTRGESFWVRNLRKSGEAGVRARAGDPRRYRATEVPAAERSAIIAAYRAKAGKTVDRYFSQLPADADHPTFRLEPIDS